MRIFRKADGYTEVSAIPDGNLVEIYVSYPGDDSLVLRGHFSAKLAWRLGLWLLRYWIQDRLMGIRHWKEQRSKKDKLFTEAELGTEH